MIGKKLNKCSCRKILYECLDKNGKRIGVTHISDEDDEYHCKYFSPSFNIIEFNTN